ncbi:MAG: F0F1 ATP synthase subunit B [Sulfurovum sp.]
MKKLALLSLFMIPALLLASADPETSRYYQQTGRENDFIPRIVNFTIFVGILYYLLANPIKNFFKGRSSDIEARLAEIQKRLQAAKDEQREAQNRLENSENRAEEIIADAKAEAVYLSEKIALESQNELSMMDKQFEEKLSLMQRKSAKAVINEVLNENITNSDIILDEKKVIDIISKKVA